MNTESVTNVIGGLRSVVPGRGWTGKRAADIDLCDDGALLTDQVVVSRTATRATQLVKL